MQRGLLYIDFDDMDKKDKITNKLANGYNTQPTDKELEVRKVCVRKLKELVTEINKVKKKLMTFTKETWDEKDRKSMVISLELTQLARKYVKKSITEISVILTVSQQEAYGGNAPRLLNILFKLATHNALSDGRLIINKTDIDLAYEEVLIEQAECISEFLKSSMGETDEDKEFERNKRILINELKLYPKGVQKSKLNDIMKTKWNTGKNKTIYYLKKLEERKVFESKKGERSEKICFLLKGGSKKEDWLEQKK